MLNKICNKFYQLSLKLAKQQPIFLYHGTSGKNLQSILSQGLVANFHDKVWKEDSNASFNFPSRVSVGGIYLTKNLMTAISSASNSVKDKENENRLIIIVQVMPNSLFADEDLLPSSVHNIILNNINSESINCYLWSDLHNNPASQDLKSAKELYISNNLKRISYSIKDDLDLRLINRLSEILNEGFLIALKRNVSYINDDEYFRYCSRASEIIPNKPDKAQSEQDYLLYLDKLTRVLNKLSLSEINRKDFGIRSARTEYNLKFSGNNKIISIIELAPVRSSDYDVKLIYKDNSPLTSKALEDFKMQYSQSMTPNFVIK